MKQKIWQRAASWLCAIALLLFPLAAQAASSAAVRSFDDVQVAGKNFAGKDLVEAQFAQADLEGANFSGANLFGAVFNSSSLVGADWSGVDFTYGIAYNTDFSGADLSDAIFADTMLLYSTFDGATIAGADFSDAILDRIQELRLCQSASGVNSQTGVATRDSLGC